jgi:hypothetical protein
MAKLVNLVRMIEALREMGIDVDSTSKVIIEISHNELPQVYTQGIATSGMLGVIKSIDGDISVVREPAPEGGN